MKIKKNDDYIVEIVDYTDNGEGIGKVDGYTLFIKDTVIGDKIRVKVIKTKKNYGYGKLLEVLEPSKDRVIPKCNLAKVCGGCTLQHLSYEKQVEYKYNKIKNCLERIGGFKNIEEKMYLLISMENPYYYRNKAQFPVGKDKNGNIVIGFYAGRTHSIIDTTHCYIQDKINDVILEKVRTFLIEQKIKPYDEETHKGLVRHILIRVGFTTRQIMVCIIINGNDLPNKEKLIESLKEIDGMTSISLNINKEKTNKILGEQIINIYGQNYIEDYIGNIKYQISPLSFYQVNPKQTKILYEKALEYAGLTGKEIVWDLYCGIGTISLFLAQKAKKVYGVEIIEQAIEDARNNAKLNDIKNVEFFVGKAEEVLPREYEKNKVYADVIVVDPPRKGCDEELLKTIIKMNPKKIVYVSCDPATLARDLRYLVDNGYEIEKVQGVDQFSQTGHVESVVLMGKSKNPSV